MKIPIIRFVEDYDVDRLQVEVWQHMELSSTNKPEGLIFSSSLFGERREPKQTIVGYFQIMTDLRHLS